ncbi:MAG: tetratricopeptide repeat protein, partial [Acidobacteriota bacterium]
MKWLALVAVVAVSAQAASNPDLERISTLARKHQYKEAISEATALLERMRREATAGSLPAARLRDLLVDATWRAGLATARTAELSEQAIAIKEKLLGPGDPAVAESYHRYGNLLRSLSRFEDSRTAYEHALAIRVQAFGEAAIEVVPTLNNLGQIEALLDDHAKAEATLRRALAIRESLLAPGDPLISNSLNTLASLFKDLGRYAEAEPLYRRALAIREAAFPPNHPKVLAALNNL